MNEIEQIVSCFAAMCHRGHPGVLATVVRTTGSTYRRVGARMLMGPSGWLSGSVSGGCLERDLVRKAEWRTAAGPAVVTYDSTGDDATATAFGLGCNGVVQVLLERLTAEDPGPLPFLRRCQAGRSRGVLATVIAGDARHPVGERLTLLDGAVDSTIADPGLRLLVEAGARGALAAGARAATYLREGRVVVLLEPIVPPRQVVLFGGNHDVIPLIDMARLVGWHVTVVSRRPPLASGRREARLEEAVPEAPPLTAEDAVVIMNHNFEEDLRALAAIWDTRLAYLGVLGPLRRTERLLASLAQAGVRVDPHKAARLHAPVGLDLGAEGPAQIALSITADIQATFASASAAPRKGAPCRPRAERRSATGALQVQS